MNLPSKGLLLVSIPLVAQLGFLAVMMATRSDQLEAQRWALHSSKVIAQAETCHRYIVEAQTHMRGYALSPAREFVDSYDEVRRLIPGEYAELLESVNDSKSQGEKVEAMAELAREFLRWMDDNMRLMGMGRTAEVRERIRAGVGRNYLGKLRGMTDDFLAVEHRLDEERQESLKRAMRWQNVALAAGGALALASCGILLLAFSQSISWRVNVLIDNTRRMAEGRELAQKLTGKDELGELDAMFHQMASAIRQKDQENELFVYSVSHDLRSPLVNLQGFSQELGMVLKDVRGLIVESELPAPRKERLAKLLDRDAGEAIGFIQSAVTRLAAIIDALLRLSRAGRVEYRPQKVDVHATVSRIAKAMNDSLAHKKAEVAVRPLPECWGDPTSIEQIFGNLIGNAVNYLDPSRPGLVEVGVVEGEKGPFTTFYVKDNGLGIPEAQQAKVFIAFQRLHPDVAPGEGIGLALVRRVVERHGGRIWLESAPGVGTTFFVSLPCEPEGLPAEHASLTPIPRKAT